VWSPPADVFLAGLNLDFAAEVQKNCADRMANAVFRAKDRLIRYGNAVPDLLFTSEASTASMNPSTFTSSRKFAFVTGLPDCDLV
jgi:hypothetical protein